MASFFMMKNVIEQLKKLDETSKQLEVSAEKRKDYLLILEKFAGRFITSLETSPTFCGDYTFDERLALDDKKKTLEELLENYQTEVVEKGINAASGGHLGYIPGGGIFASALADFLAAVTNPYAGVFYASPGAVVIENEVLTWLKKTFSFPKSAVGNLSSGGSISTLIALTAARDKHEVKNEKIQKSTIYLSEQTHHSTLKALRIIGLADVVIRKIPLDENHRMKTKALAEKIKEDRKKGLTPYLVVATAGTTDSGAVDPLNDIAEICVENKLWFHVDAAYGGFFILTSQKHLFKGIEKADSLVVDPHKGLFLPYGLGAVLIRDKQAVMASNHYFANYMQDAQMADLSYSPADVSPELTKHFRGLRLWLPLKLHGVEPFVACLEEKLLLTHYFRTKLAEMGFEIGPEPDLSVSYFRYPFKKNADTKNKALLEAIHKDGRVFLSSSQINGHFVIRIAILSFRTKLSTINTATEMIANCLKQVQQHSI